jgi:hypothetical protein
MLRSMAPSQLEVSRGMREAIARNMAIATASVRTRSIG